MSVVSGNHPARRPKAPPQGAGEGGKGQGQRGAGQRTRVFAMQQQASSNRRSGPVPDSCGAAKTSILLSDSSRPSRPPAPW
jgi:hypothetical protein